MATVGPGELFLEAELAFIFGKWILVGNPRMYGGACAPGLNQEPAKLQGWQSERVVTCRASLSCPLCMPLLAFLCESLGVKSQEGQWGEAQHRSETGQCSQSSDRGKQSEA